MNKILTISSVLTVLIIFCLFTDNIVNRITKKSTVHEVAVTTSASPVHMNIAQADSLLRSEAAKRKIKWEVICVPTYDPNGHNSYQADAYQPDDIDVMDRYVNHGAKDWWAVTENTLEEAEYNLYLVIQKSPTIKAVQEPPVLKNNSGCNYNIILDSKHKGLIPCDKEK